MEGLFALIGIVTLPLTCALAVAWRMSRAELRRERGEVTGERPALAGAGALRFDRLEQAVDNIAAEIERIAEAQRFTASLLGERGPAARPRAVEHPTPH